MEVKAAVAHAAGKPLTPKPFVLMVRKTERCWWKLWLRVFAIPMRFTLSGRSRRHLPVDFRA